MKMETRDEWKAYFAKIQNEGFMPGLVRMEVQGQEIFCDDAGNITGMGFTGGTERIRVWVVGQVNLDGTGEPIEGSWQMQGVFRSQAKAEAACRDYSYFVGPMWVDESLSHQLAAEWLGAYFPIARKATEAPHTAFGELADTPIKLRTLQPPSEVAGKCMHRNSSWDATMTKGRCKDCGESMAKFPDIQSDGVTKVEVRNDIAEFTEFRITKPFDSTESSGVEFAVGIAEKGQAPTFKARPFDFIAEGGSACVRSLPYIARDVHCDCTECVKRRERMKAVHEKAHPAPGLDPRIVDSDAVLRHAIGVNSIGVDPEQPTG